MSERLYQPDHLPPTPERGPVADTYRLLTAAYRGEMTERREQVALQLIAEGSHAALLRSMAEHWDQNAAAQARARDAEQQWLSIGPERETEPGSLEAAAWDTRKQQALAEAEEQRTQAGILAEEFMGVVDAAIEGNPQLPPERPPVEHPPTDEWN